MGGDATNTLFKPKCCTNPEIGLITPVIGYYCKKCGWTDAKKTRDWIEKGKLADAAIKELLEALENMLELLDDYDGTNDSIMKVLLAEAALAKYKTPSE